MLTDQGRATIGLFVPLAFASLLVLFGSYLTLVSELTRKVEFVGLTLFAGWWALAIIRMMRVPLEHRLELRADGFFVETFAGQRFYPWDAVSEFRVSEHGVLFKDRRRDLLCALTEPQTIISRYAWAGTFEELAAMMRAASARGAA